MSCPCKSNKPYMACCQPIISGVRLAATAEQLMRSRYSAFVMADVDYLMASHHRSTRPLREKRSILAFATSVQWLGLHIVSTQGGMATDTEGWVQFKASYLESGQLQCIHEHSYFVKEKGVWYYKHGVHQ